MSAFSLVLRVAFRNLGRNRRRTLITGAGIALGVGMCIATFGIVDGLDGDIVRGVTDTEVGHIQVHAADYLTARSLSKTIEDAPAATAAIAREDGISAVARRVYGWGLASRGDQSRGVQLVGVEPRREGEVTKLASKLVAGSFVSNQPTPWIDARSLTAAEQVQDDELTQRALHAALAELDGKTDAASPPSRAETQALVREMAPPPSAPPGVVVGIKLAEKLRAKVGDRIEFMTQDAHGAPVDVGLRIAGVFRTGTDAIDRTRVIANLADAQHLLGLGSQVHELAICTTDGKKADSLASHIRALPALARLDVKSWQQLRPDVVQMVGADEALMNALLVIVFMVAGLGVANTMQMAIFERKVELSVIKALGMKPVTILGMIVLETFLLGIAACAVGATLGVGLDLLLARFGWNVDTLGKFSLAGVGLDPSLHAELSAGGVGLPILAILSMALLGSLYPALVAARVEPAVGMREAT